MSADRVLRVLLSVGCWVLASWSLLTAQTLIPQVPYRTGRVHWSWTKGGPPNDLEVQGFRLRCGSAPGQYTLPVHPYSADARTAWIRDLVPQEGTFYCQVTAWHEAEYASAGQELAFTAMPPDPGPDLTPPDVTIVEPVDGSTVPPARALVIAITATDNVAVTRLGVTVNGQSLCVVFAPPWRCAWTVPKGANVRYTINAQALDAAGNNAQHEISVIAK